MQPLVVVPVDEEEDWADHALSGLLFGFEEEVEDDNDGRDTNCCNTTKARPLSKEESTAASFAISVAIDDFLESLVSDDVIIQTPSRHSLAAGRAPSSKKGVKRGRDEDEEEQHCGQSLLVTDKQRLALSLLAAVLDQLHNPKIGKGQEEAPHAAAAVGLNNAKSILELMRIFELISSSPLQSHRDMLATVDLFEMAKETRDPHPYLTSYCRERQLGLQERQEVEAKKENAPMNTQTVGPGGANDAKNVPHTDEPHPYITSYCNDAKNEPSSSHVPHTDEKGGRAESRRRRTVLSILLDVFAYFSSHLSALFCRSWSYPSDHEFYLKDEEECLKGSRGSSFQTDLILMGIVRVNVQVIARIARGSHTHRDLLLNEIFVEPACRSDLCYYHFDPDDCRPRSTKSTTSMAADDTRTTTAAASATPQTTFQHELCSLFLDSMMLCRFIHYEKGDLHHVFGGIDWPRGFSSTNCCPRSTEKDGVGKGKGQCGCIRMLRIQEFSRLRSSLAWAMLALVSCENTNKAIIIDENGAEHAAASKEEKPRPEFVLVNCIYILAETLLSDGFLHHEQRRRRDSSDVPRAFLSMSAVVLTDRVEHRCLLTLLKIMCCFADTVHNVGIFRRYSFLQNTLRLFWSGRWANRKSEEVGTEEDDADYFPGDGSVEAATSFRIAEMNTLRVSSDQMEDVFAYLPVEHASRLILLSNPDFIYNSLASGTRRRSEILERLWRRFVWSCGELRLSALKILAHLVFRETTSETTKVIKMGGGWFLEKIAADLCDDDAQHYTNGDNQRRNKNLEMLLWALSSLCAETLRLTSYVGTRRVFLEAINIGLFHEDPKVVQKAVWCVVKISHNLPEFLARDEYAVNNLLIPAIGLHLLCSVAGEAIGRKYVADRNDEVNGTTDVATDKRASVKKVNSPFRLLFELFCEAWRRKSAHTIWYDAAYDGRESNDNGDVDPLVKERDQQDYDPERSGENNTKLERSAIVAALNSFSNECLVNNNDNIGTACTSYDSYKKEASVLGVVSRTAGVNNVPEWSNFLPPLAARRKIAELLMSCRKGLLIGGGAAMDDLSEGYTWREAVCSLANWSSIPSPYSSSCSRCGNDESTTNDREDEDEEGGTTINTHDDDDDYTSSDYEFEEDYDEELRKLVYFLFFLVSEELRQPHFFSISNTT